MWQARVDVYRHLVQQKRAGGVRCVDVLINVYAVNGENEAGQRRGSLDSVGDDIVDVDSLADECHRDGRVRLVGMIGGVAPGPIVCLCNVHCGSSCPASMLFKSEVPRVDIACSTSRAGSPATCREVCRVETCSAVTKCVVYCVIDNDGGRCKHWQKVEASQVFHML